MQKVAKGMRRRNMTSRQGLTVFVSGKTVTINTLRHPNHKSAYRVPQNGVSENIVVCVHCAA